MHPRGSLRRASQEAHRAGSVLRAPERNPYEKKWPILGVPLATWIAWLLVLGTIGYFLYYSLREHDERREARLANDQLTRQLCRMLETDWHAGTAEALTDPSVLHAKLKRLSRFTRYLAPGAIAATAWRAHDGTLFSVLRHEDELPDADDEESAQGNALTILGALAHESLQLTNQSRCVEAPDMQEDPGIDARKARYYSVQNMARVSGTRVGARTFELTGALRYDGYKQRWRLGNMRLRWRKVAEE